MAFARRQQSDASLAYADMRAFIDIIDQEWEMDGLSDDGALRARPTRMNAPARFQNVACVRRSLRAILLTRVAARHAFYSNYVDIAVPGQFIDQADDDGGACVLHMSWCAVHRLRLT